MSGVSRFGLEVRGLSLVLGRDAASTDSRILSITGGERKRSTRSGSN
jgi:hypothetical protein